ncbi:hypothetical protein [Marinobacter sp. OP 3.4]|uniref:hypothetical protein n=1 Tax=Marinobacter sp. OP 3.4 TaxID=3076501 RepID=UPI002E23997C
MPDTKQIARKAAEKIYRINVQQRVRNRAHYIELIEGAVLEAIEQAKAAHPTDSGGDQ